MTAVCNTCGGEFPVMPGVPASINLPAAHVRADGTTTHYPPCDTGANRHARKMFKLDQVAIFAALDLWSSELVHDEPLPDEDARDDQPQAADPSNWTGACRSEGVSW